MYTYNYNVTIHFMDDSVVDTYIPNTKDTKDNITSKIIRFGFSHDNHLGETTAYSSNFIKKVVIRER
jgi:hypothetical protein